MSYFEAFILALIQGLTEFLPISSSAHLILPSAILGWEDQGLLGFMLAQTKHFKPAFGQHFGHHRNHLAGADVQCNDQVFDVTSHMFFTSQG